VIVIVHFTSSMMEVNHVHLAQIFLLVGKVIQSNPPLSIQVPKSENDDQFVGQSVITKTCIDSHKSKAEQNLGKLYVHGQIRVETDIKYNNKVDLKGISREYEGEFGYRPLSDSEILKFHSQKI
jgi:hypothetical protein